MFAQPEVLSTAKVPKNVQQPSKEKIQKTSIFAVTHFIQFSSLCIKPTNSDWVWAGE